MADRSVVVRLVANTAGFAAPLKAASAQAKAFGSELDAASQKNSTGFQKVAEGATIAGAGILAAFGGMIAVTMQFDKQMSAVGAAANATSGQLGQLRDAALEAGAATAFSATDAARAEEELAKAGVSVKDILGGGLKGALDLAAAGQMDLGEAAEIAATAMTQFKLSGDQVPHVADLLSAAANNAQGSVHDMGFALKSGGLVAAQFGISVEETTGTLASFASAGLLGSDAGTSLKTMLIALANPSEKAAGVMQELGINAYDASGKFVGLSNLAGQLQTKMGGLSDAQRQQALATIFGSDAIRAASVLYDQGSTGIADWTNKVNDSGNAARTAAAKMDNLSGDVEKLKGSFETALIQTGSASTGVLRTLTQAADGAVSGFSALPGPVQSTVAVLGLVAGSALLAAGGYGTLAPKVREARTALEGMGPAGTKANAALGATVGFVGKATAVMAAFQIASAAFGDSSNASGVSVEKLSASLTKLGETGKVSGGMVDVLHGRMKALKDDMLALDTSGMGQFGNGVASTIESLTGLGNVMDSSFTKSKARIAELDTALAAMVSSGHGEEAAAAFKKIEDAAKSQGIKVSELKAGFSQYSAAVDKMKASTDAGAIAQENAAQATKVMSDGFRSAAQEADGLKTAWDQLNGAMMSTDQAMLAASQAVDKVKQSFESNGTAIKGNSQAALQNRIAVEAAGKAAAEAAQAVLDGGGSVDQARATWDRYTAQLRAQLIQSGLSAAAADKLIASVNRMPDFKAAKLSTPGATESTAEVDKLNQQINALKDKQAKITESGAPDAQAKVAALQRQIESLRDRVVQISEAGAPGATGEVAALQRQIAALTNKQAKISQAGAQDAARQVSALQSQINALRDKVVRVTYFETRQVTTGSGEVAMHGSRWGNVFSYASGGVTAKIAGPGTLYQWAEPATGGEAFIPRLGNYERSMGILQTAASWYGAQVTGGRASRPAAVAASPAVQAAGPMASGPSIDYRKLGRALAAAMGDVQVTIDGRRVGAIQGREADLFSRAG